MYRIGGSLGSGEFGVVSRGRWLGVVCGPVEVAIKTLRPAANEDSKVSFLQEAAVIGQFKHPNIVNFMELSQWMIQFMCSMYEVHVVCVKNR